MKLKTFLIAAALISIALDSRAPITCVGPIASEMREAFSLSYQGYAFLTSIPILCLGGFSLAAPALARKTSTGTALLILFLLMAAGLAGRLFPSAAVLFAATAATGAAIAMLNAILPVLVRHFFADRVTAAMGVFTALIGASSTLGAYLAVPLLHAGGSYRWPLGFWLIPVAVSIAAWLAAGEKALPSFQQAGRLDLSLALRLPAWAVFFTMGMQSLTVYTVVGWLPSILAGKGFSLSDAALCTSVFVLISAPASLFTAKLAAWCGGERNLSLVMAASFVAGVFCWSLGGAWAYLGSVLAGIPQGVELSLAMILFSKKSESLDQMLAISSLGQFAGYLLAGIGLALCGRLYAGDGNWTPILVFFALADAVWGAAAFYAFGPCRVFKGKKP